MRADGSAANKAAATGPTSDAAACMNVTVHNGETFSAGDVIVVSDAGGDFTDAILTPPSSGSVGNVITYTNDGTPVISAAAARTMTAYVKNTGDLLEDNFDDGDTTGWTGVGTPSPAASTEQAHSGTYSVKSTTAYKTLYQTIAAQAEIWCRLYLYPVTGLSGNSGNLLFRVGGTSIVTFAIQTDGGLDAWNLVASEGYASSGTMNLDAWNLVECRVKIGNGTGEVECKINGAQVINATSKNTGTDSIDRWEFGQLNTNNTLYYDDIGVDSSGFLGPVYADGDVGYVSLVADPVSVLLDGTLAVEETVSYSLLAAGEWFWDAGNTNLWVRTSGGAIGSSVVKTFARASCIVLSDKDYLTFQGLTLQGPCQWNAFSTTTGGTGIIIDTCTFNDVWFNGLSVSNSNADVLSYTITDCVFNEAGKTTNITITHGSSSASSVAISGTTHTCSFFDGTTATGSNVMKAIELVNIDTVVTVQSVAVTFPSVVGDTSTLNITGCETPLVEHCSIVGGNHGITLNNAANGGTVRYNYTRDTYDDGIWVYGTSDGVEIYYNLVTGSNDDGIDIDGAPNCRVWSNTVARSVDTGILVRETSTAVHVKNNILFENGQPGTPTTGDEGGHEILVTADSTTNFVADNNCFYHTTDKVTSTPFSWSGTSYNFADWQTNSSQDANSINSDPLLANAGGTTAADYKITSGSPCKNAGVDVGLLTDYFGVAVGDPPEIGFSEYPVSATESTATVPNGTAGAATSITVQAKDGDGNNMTVGGATVVVNVTGANTATPSVTDEGDGTYTCSYTPTTPGADSVAITLDGTAISGSPYASTVVSVGGVIDPSLIGMKLGPNPLSVIRI